MRNTIITMLVSALCATSAVWAQDVEDDFDPNFVAPRSKVAPGLGRDPSDLAIKTYGVNPIGLGGGGEDAEKNNFYYTGFFRAPFNFGIGTNQTIDGVGSDKLALHALPVIPDTSYLDWRYTNNHGGPWAEIRFTFGNRKVSGNVNLATYNLTTGSYKKLAAQLGISEAFVSINLPGLMGGRGGLVANVGVFSARYGEAGRYDAGMYDTYLFGATKTGGEQLRIYYDLSPSLTLHIEQGFGGMIEVAPFMQYELVDQNKNVVTNGEAKTPVPNPLATQPWVPYGGSDWPQGDTLLHHEHIGFSVRDKFFVGAHLMHEFSIDQDDFDTQRGSNKRGHLINTGIDFRFRDFFWGNLYLGYAHTYLKNPLRLGGALEALHSVGGWAWNQNFFKPGSINPPPGGTTPMTSTNGDAKGTIDTIVGQYELSLAKLLWYPKEFWGQDKDVVITLFGMLNFVDSDSPLFTAATAKFKWGADVMYTPLPWFGLGGRVDVVQPDMDNSTLSFTEYSGKLLFRTKYITHENIIVQYTYYDLGENVIPGYPWNNDAETGAMKPDKHVITIGASMWW